VADDRRASLGPVRDAARQSETGVIGLNNDDVQQVVRLGVEPIGDGYVTRPLNISSLTSVIFMVRPASISIVHVCGCVVVQVTLT